MGTRLASVYRLLSSVSTTILPLAAVGADNQEQQSATSEHKRTGGPRPEEMDE